jgi:hypothetical protein
MPAIRWRIFWIWYCPEKNETKTPEKNKKTFYFYRENG